MSYEYTNAELVKAGFDVHVDRTNCTSWCGLRADHPLLLGQVPRGGFCAGNGSMTTYWCDLRCFEEKRRPKVMVGDTWAYGRHELSGLRTVVGVSRHAVMTAGGTEIPMDLFDDTSTVCKLELISRAPAAPESEAFSHPAAGYYEKAAARIREAFTEVPVRYSGASMHISFNGHPIPDFGSERIAYDPPKLTPLPDLRQAIDVLTGAELDRLGSSAFGLVRHRHEIDASFRGRLKSYVGVAPVAESWTPVAGVDVGIEDGDRTALTISDSNGPLFSLTSILLADTMSFWEQIKLVIDDLNLQLGGVLLCLGGCGKTTPSTTHGVSKKIAWMCAECSARNRPPAPLTEPPLPLKLVDGSGDGVARNATPAPAPAPTCCRIGGVKSLEGLPCPLHPPPAAPWTPGWDAYGFLKP